MSLKIVVEGVGDIAAGVKRTIAITEDFVGHEINKGARTVRDSADKLANVPFKVRSNGLWRNVQESPRRYRLGGRNLVEARINSAKTEAMVVAKAHVTAARTKAVKNVFSLLGRTQRFLIRKSLWIKRGSSRAGNRSHQGHPNRAGLMQVSLSGGLSRFGNSRQHWIRKWAGPKDLHLRDTTWLAGEALNLIILRPAVKRNEKQILAALRLAVRRGMK